MASAAGFLRNFRETVTVALTDNAAEIASLEDKLAECKAERERLVKLAHADGIVYGGNAIRLMDSVAGGDDDDEERAA
jgi:hypothetical protein